MADSTGTQPAEVVTWRRLRRVNVHRTSEPTNTALRSLAGEIMARRGAAPWIDAVILAALRIAAAEPIERLMDMVREVETDTYPQPRIHREPGA
jgi:hypothetical protein